jgi:poly(3-hydroxyalkanoate) depolymerase
VSARTTQRPEHVEVDDLRLRVRINGKGQPLLLLNGIGGTAEMWEPLVAYLERFQTIALDVPGTGESDVPALPLSMPRLARLVAAAVRQLGYEQVDVLGLSFGGALAQQLAHTAPDVVRRLVLASTTCGLGGPPGRPAAMLALATPLRYYSPSYHERSAATLYGGRLRRETHLVAEQAEDRFSHPPDPRGYAWQLAAIGGWSSLPWLHKVQHPTLVLIGDDDPIVPLANARLLASRLPHGRLHIVPEGGHLFLLDSPDQAAAVIAEHLRDGSRPDRRAAALGVLTRLAYPIRSLWPKVRRLLRGVPR